ncbi:MAG TPA: hypothetical protein VGB67_00245 [Fibrella sp.]|jgi:hypothetical protein
MKQTAGVDLIAIERDEQINKHGFKETDAEYKDGQLASAAAYAISLHHGYWPKGWDDHFKDKIANKSRKERMIVAGAFCAAEIDRLLALETQVPPELDLLIAEINYLTGWYCEYVKADEGILFYMKPERLQDGEVLGSTVVHMVGKIMERMGFLFSELKFRNHNRSPHLCTMIAYELRKDEQATVVDDVPPAPRATDKIKTWNDAVVWARSHQISPIPRSYSDDHHRWYDCLSAKAEDQRLVFTDQVGGKIELNILPGIRAVSENTNSFYTSRPTERIPTTNQLLSWDDAIEWSQRHQIAHRPASGEPLSWYTFQMLQATFGCVVFQFGEGQNKDEIKIDSLTSFVSLSNDTHRFYVARDIHQIDTEVLNTAELSWEDVVVWADSHQIQYRDGQPGWQTLVGTDGEKGTLTFRRKYGGADTTLYAMDIAAIKAGKHYIFEGRQTQP